MKARARDISGETPRLNDMACSLSLHEHFLKGRNKAINTKANSAKKKGSIWWVGPSPLSCSDDISKGGSVGLDVLDV